MKWVFSPHMVVVSSFYLSQNRQAQCSQRSRFSLWLSTKTRAEWLSDPSCIIYGRDGLIEALLESHWAADQLKDSCANKSPALSWFQIGRVGTHTNRHSLTHPHSNTNNTVSQHRHNRGCPAKGLADGNAVPVKGSGCGLQIRTNIWD